MAPAAVRVARGIIRVGWVCIALCLAPPAGEAAVTAGPAPIDRVWLSRIGTDHPLTGRIWSPADDALVDLDRVRSAIAGHGVVLLGEVHDNADHHSLRAALITDVAVEGVRPALVVEHVRADQEAALATARQAGAIDAFFEALDWQASGWQPTAAFAPLYETALRLRLPIIAGNVARDRLRAVAKKGDSALEPREATRLHLNEPLAFDLQANLLDELEASHCGLMPREAFGAMAVAQRYRDGHLADALVRASKESGTAILLAGNGHVRADRGVPWYVERMAPGTPVLVVMFVEVEAGRDEARLYADLASGGRIADFVVFTPRATRPDPCETMRKSYGKKAP